MNDTGRRALIHLQIGTPAEIKYAEITGRNREVRPIRRPPELASGFHTISTEHFFDDEGRIDREKVEARTASDRPEVWADHVK